MTIFQKVSIISFGDRAVGSTIKLRQSPGPGPAPRDTSLFRERGRTAGVCRVESTAGTRQGETGLTKGGNIYNDAPASPSISSAFFNQSIFIISKLFHQKGYINLSIRYIPVIMSVKNNGISS